MKQIYLDQNVISKVAEGKLKLPVSNDDIRWLFSGETISEINRANIKQKYIDVLVFLKACPFFKDEVYVGLDITSFVDGMNTEFRNKNMMRAKELQVALLTAEASINYDDVLKARNTLGLSDNGISRAIANELSPIGSMWDLIKNNTKLSIDEFFAFKVGGKYVSLSQGIVNSTAVLNRIGYFPDKSLRNANNVENIFSDRWHTSQAARFDGIISLDERLCEKARAIYLWKKPSCIVYYPVTKNKDIKCEERNGLKHFKQVSCLKKGWLY